VLSVLSKFTFFWLKVYIKAFTFVLHISDI